MQGNVQGDEVFYAAGVQVLEGGGRQALRNPTHVGRRLLCTWFDAIQRDVSVEDF